MIDIGVKITAQSSAILDDQFKTDEERYKWQMEVRANYLLLGDKNVNVQVSASKMPKAVLNTAIQWINKGELIAGSFMSGAINGSQVEHNDIDIYFKEEIDMKLFMHNNPRMRAYHKNDVLVTADGNGKKFNLIFGVKYENAADLISHFDIRACSIALDPNDNTVYVVQGAIQDCCSRRLVYNPVPHNTTIARLVKYAKKGFFIDPYQRLFLVELIKSDQYNIDLEMTTGYRGVE